MSGHEPARYRAVLRLALRWLVILSLPLFVIAMMQDSLLYYPEKTSIDALKANARHTGQRLWPSEAAFRGLIAEPNDRPALGTVIVFHGNAGHAGHRDFYLPPLKALGLRVILAEYPGYGPREGSLGEKSLVTDAGETLRLAREEFGGPIYLLGESLGAGVAAAVLTERGDEVDGILLATPWDSLKSIAGHHYPWLPVSLLLRDRYDSVENLKAYKGRVSVVLAAQDQIIPREFGEALFASLNGKKQLDALQGADHNDWFERTDAAWWARQMGFLSEGQKTDG